VTTSTRQRIAGALSNEETRAQFEEFKRLLGLAADRFGSEVVNHPPAASARGRKVNSMGQHVDLVGV